MSYNAKPNLYLWNYYSPTHHTAKAVTIGNFTMFFFKDICIGFEIESYLTRHILITAGKPDFDLLSKFLELSCANPVLLYSNDFYAKLYEQMFKHFGPVVNISADLPNRRGYRFL